MAVVDDELAAQFKKQRRELEVDNIFRSVVKLKGSDLHMKAGKPPYVRVNGSLRPMNREPIDDDEMVRLCFPLLDDRNRRIFEFFMPKAITTIRCRLTEKV